jgi:hypothetical protein
MWTEVSSSVRHFLQVRLLLSPILYKCLFRACPASRPVTTLHCVLLRDSNWGPEARSVPEINSRACLYVLQWQRHNARCCFSIQHFIFLLIFCLETPKKDSGPTKRWTERPLASLLYNLNPPSIKFFHTPTIWTGQVRHLGLPSTPHWSTSSTSANHRLGQLYPILNL